MALNLNLYKRNEDNSDNLVILIHGLGASESTWNQGGVSWIDLLLTDDSLTGLDVAEITYDTSHLANGILSLMGVEKIKLGIFSNFTVGKGPFTTIDILARELKREVDSKRIKQYKNVVLIGHSMGGLVAIRYLLEELEHNQPQNIKGIISIATPYNGSSLALFGQLIRRINKNAQIPSLEPNSKFLDKTIRLWQKHLSVINTKFHFFFGTEDRVVSENSAIPIVVSSKWEKGIPLPGDHSSILKVVDHSSTNYIHISEAVCEIIESDLNFKKNEIDKQKQLLKAKSITRLKANGLSEVQAIHILEHNEYNFDYLLPNAEKRLIVVVGEFGIGKSFTIDRINLSLLSRAEKEVDFPIPINLNATQLNNNIQNFLEQIILDTTKEYWITVDGMDEVALSFAANILENMRVATERWSNLRIILTSRPLTIFNKIPEKIFIKGLTDRESLKLVNFISTQESNVLLQTLPKDIKVVIQKPLFAILLGLYLNSQSRGVPNTSGDLLAFFIENALEKIEVNEPKTRMLLTNLAVASTSRGNIPVKKSEIGDLEEIKSLINSGIVIEEEGYLTFALPILNQWFAAKALSQKTIMINEIIDRNTLDYWKYPLVILITIFKESNINEVLSEVVEKDPGFATLLIEESINKWGIHGDETALTSWECASKIRMSMYHWVNSLGILANIIAPIDRSGHILPLGVAKDGAWLRTSWYQGIKNVPEITIFEKQQHYSGWETHISARPGDGSSWYWRWTLEELKDNLTNHIKNRTLPICTEIVYKELMWSITLKIAKKGSLYTHSINIRTVKNIIDAEYQYIENIKSEKSFVPKRMYLDYLEKLESDGASIIECPILGSDIEEPEKNMIWSFYTEERLYNRTLQIYREAIMGYREIVEMFFPSIKNRLRKYVLYPFVLKGEYRAPEYYGARSIGPGLNWYLEPLPFERRDFILDIEITKRESKGYDEKLLYELDEKIKMYRPDSINWLTSSQTSQVLEVFGDKPVTNIIYEWLERDLAAINWIK